MVPHTLPLETIEYTLGFLGEDFKTLAKCSLVCRAFLPTCQTHLYGDIRLSHKVVRDNETVETKRTKRFFKLADGNPDILLYVRNLTLDYGQDIFRHLPLRAISPSIAWKNVLRRRFSSLRSLTLCYLTMLDSLSYLTMIITGIYPKLESLSFHHVQVRHSSDFYGVQLSVETNWEPDVWVARGGAARSRLRAFRLVDAYDKSDELSALVSFLGNYRRLDSLDIRSQPELPGASLLPAYPRLSIAQFPSRLTRLGVLVHDVKRDGQIAQENRERMEAILSDLPRFRSLRSLCVHYSCIGFYLNKLKHSHQLYARRTAPSLNPFFLYTLCHVLSSTPDPFPFLEELVIVLHNPLYWLRDWTDALDNLARVLIGGRVVPENALLAEGATRYPRFRRLEICASISELVRLEYGDKGVEDVCKQVREVKEGFFRPFLQRFEDVGIEVDIKVI
ncbi:hypothetical protein FKP32DRAFT_1680716 [Trametes sanguinea]|nr:hypothetical protein FKP32DRAFT_1680716 [Trametes sanguinea]